MTFTKYRKYVVTKIKDPTSKGVGGEEKAGGGVSLCGGEGDTKEGGVL